MTPAKPVSRTGDSKHESLMRSASVVSAAVFLSRITGLIREIAMARLFGAGQVYDAFLLGFRIPNLTRDLFAEGALSSAFVPIFTKYLSTRGKQEAAELSNLVATALLLVVGVVCVLGMIFSPALVSLLAPGFAAVPGKFELAVKLTRIMFPFLLLVALAAQAMGILNACNQFGVPALSSTFFNIGSLGFGLVLGYLAGPRIGLSPIEGMAYGVVLGGAWQLFWQMPSLLRAGFAFRPRMNFSHPGLRNILKLMGPAIVGNASVQVNVMVNTNFASSITDAAGHVINGPVSWLGYAFRFMQLPLGLFGVAIASATLLIGGTCRAGRQHDCRGVSGRPFPRLRYASDCAGTLVLLHRPGRLCGDQSARAGLLRAQRCAHAHAGEPGFYPDKRYCSFQHGEVCRPGACRPGAFHFAGCAVQLDRAVRRPPPENWRHPGPSLERQLREDRGGLRDNGSGLRPIEPVHRALARRFAHGAGD